MIARVTVAVALVGAVLASGGCGDERIYDERRQSTGYRSGTVDDDYLSNGERGSVQISEIGWAGSVEQVGDGFVHDPDDIFLEIQNKYTRPVHITGWQLIVRAGTGAHDEEYERNHRPIVTYVMPARENAEPIEPNEYVVIARRRDGAFADADYFIEDLHIPRDRFEITLRDLDHRLIEGVGDYETEIFAGAWDLVTARSMERVQLIFSNNGDSQASWHSYGLNGWDGGLHATLRDRIAEPFRARTFASPGRANSPDFSGNTSAGSFE